MHENFQIIRSASLPYILPIVERLLPSGHVAGREYCAINPRRNYTRAGSFKINLKSGKWADFATDDKGSDIISLYAFVIGVSQHDAMMAIAQMIGHKIDQKKGRP